MTIAPEERNGWGEYRKLVVHELERLNDDMADFRKEVKHDLKKINDDVLTLKVKAATWGGFAGFLLGLVANMIGRALPFGK